MQNFQNYDNAIKDHGEKMSEMQGAIERINVSIGGGYAPSLNNYSQLAVAPKGTATITMSESLQDVVFDTVSL